MSLKHYYQDAARATQEMTAHVDTLQKVTFATAAEQGRVESSEIKVDDPTGTFDIHGHRGVWAEETACPANDQRLYTGFAGIRSTERDLPPGFDTGVARKITIPLSDPNTNLSRKIMEGSDANRPAETDVERMLWLLGTSEAALYIQDSTTYFSSAHPVALDKADLRGRGLFDIIKDCADASGKNFWLNAIPDGVGNYPGTFWYDFASSSAYTSALSISNDPGDIDSSTVFAASADTQFTRDPSRVYSGVHGDYDGGSVFVQRAATATAFADRDTTTSWPLVKSSAKATARANRYLVEISTEEDLIKTRVRVPAAKATAIKAGMLVSAKFTHLTDYADFTGMRVLDVKATLVPPSNYDLALTLSPQGPAGSASISCSTQIAGPLGDTLWDTGDIANGPGGTPPITVANGLTPPDAAQAYLALVIWEGRRVDTSALTLDGGDTGNYTQIHNTREGNVSDQGSIGLFGYAAVDAGDMPPDFIAEFTPSWTGGFTGGGFMRALGVLVATAETAPLQVSAVGHSSTIVFPSPVTAGSVVIAALIREGSTTAAPTGWTNLGTVVMAVGTGGTQLSLFAKCMAGSEGDTLTVVDASETHWWMAAEVKIS